MSGTYADPSSPFALEARAVQFTLPEDLTALSADDLAAAESDALEEFDGLRAVGDDLTDEQVDDMEALAGHISAIRAEDARRQTQAADRRARADAAAATIDPPAEDTQTEPEPGEEGGAGGEGEEDDEEEEPEVAEPPAEAPQQVAASLVRRTPRVPNPVPKGRKDSSPITLTAAADVTGFPAGSRYADGRAMAQGFINRSSAFPTFDQGGDAPLPDEPGGPQAGIYLRHSVASISRNSRAELDTRNIGREYDSAESLLDDAARQSRLKGGSLVAAGGWCAPSETLYDLCGGAESVDNMLDLPTITVRRGGLRFTTGPNFSDIAAKGGFCLTEAQVIAGTQKTCFTIDCPPFTEVRLDACGLCIKAPILTNAAWPELVDRWISGSLVAHQHVMNVRAVNAIATALGSATASGAQNADGILTALELAAIGLRYQWRLGENTTLEVVLPLWVKAAIRADLAARTGLENSLSVSDAQINGFFAARNLAVQFIFGYQEDNFSSGCVTEFPTDVEALIYPAGTFVKGTLDVISLDTIYDTTDLLSNIYTALFMEEGILVTQRCYGGCRLTVPVCVSGQTGASDRTACLAAATAP